MPIDPIVRTTYTDPNQGDAQRPGFTENRESQVDQFMYARPLERLHGSGLHDWGIGEGLAVAATLNENKIRVLPGVCVDAEGRHIFLAEGGKAEIGPKANNPAETRKLINVLATGAELPTLDRDPGAYFVSVTWHETFDADLFTTSLRKKFQMMHTPWIRLEPAAEVTDATDDGRRVVLGRIEIADGKVTALTHQRRREVGMPAGSIEFWRGETTSSASTIKADNAITAELRARAAGGLEIEVRGAADQIDFRRDVGNIAKVSFGADMIVGRRADLRESVVIEPVVGSIRLGTQGVAGQVITNDANDRRVIVLDGATASATIGAATNAGDIQVMDAAGQPSMRVDGATGTVFQKRLAASSGGVIHVDAAQLQIHGSDLILDGRSGRANRALVDGNNRLIVNFNGDYRGGVDVIGLHLAAHIKTGFWEEDLPVYPISDPLAWLPPDGEWEELYSVDTQLQSSEWDCVTFCEIGMHELGGTMVTFWWKTMNRSFVSNDGTIIIKWDINTKGREPWDFPHWYPSNRKVFWLAFRK